MQKLIFVYNANSGTRNMVLDVAHKLFSPKTYDCKLCAITFDVFSENKSWKTFREKSAIEMEFLHSDEFEKKYKSNQFKYPIILSVKNATLNVFLSSEKINKIKSVEELTNTIKTLYNLNV